LQNSCLQIRRKNRKAGNRKTNQQKEELKVQKNRITQKNQNMRKTKKRRVPIMKSLQKRRRRKKKHKKCILILNLTVITLLLK